MAILRNVILFFVIAFSSLLHAETISTVPVHYWSANQPSGLTSATAVCATLGAGAYPKNSPPSNIGQYQFCFYPGMAEFHPMGWWSYACPQGYTLENGSCTRPDCAPNETRDANGVCVNACASKTGQESFGWVTYDKGSPPWGSKCSGGCEVYQTNGADPSKPANLGLFYYTSTTETRQMKTQYSGATCTSDAAPASETNPPTKQPPEPPKKPLCGSTEGVLTSSAGTVACVPEGTPSAEKPTLNKTVKAETFPDGSSKTTETIVTQAPSTGAKETNVIITATPKTGGGTGDAGTPGTGTASLSSAPTVGPSGTGSGGDGKSTSGFCADNPGLQICKGGMNEEATQIQVRDYIKSLTDPGSTPFTDLVEAKQTTKSDDDLKEQTDKFQAAAEGTFSPNSASRNSWQSAMESGWFEPISRQGCQPYSAAIGGRTWSLDICPTAEKISVISEYVIWFLLVVGTFVMMTGGVFTRNS